MVTTLNDNIGEIFLQLHSYIFRLSVQRYFSHMPNAAHLVRLIQTAHRYQAPIITVRFSLAVEILNLHMELYRPS